MLPQPKPGAVRQLLIVPLIRRGDVAFSQRPHIRRFKHFFYLLNFVNNAFNVHFPDSIAMATPELTPDQITQISGLVADYISIQRQKFFRRAIPLTARQRLAVAPFFAPVLLDNVLVLVLEGERVPNPDFYAMLRDLGFKKLPDQSAMAAITFRDVVVSHEPFSYGLLFHELVHVEQYRQFGITRFADLYVHGFLNGGSYEAIPLELNAYNLEERFRRDPRRIFSVQQEVAEWAAKGRLG